MRTLLVMVLLCMVSITNAAITNKISLRVDEAGDEYLIVARGPNVVIYSRKPQIQLNNHGKPFNYGATVISDKEFNQVKENIKK